MRQLGFIIKTLQVNDLKSALTAEAMIEFGQVLPSGEIAHIVAPKVF
jgi:hypothetical protein